MRKHWDIFCKIVDNFGDIGICWRLARQLHAEHGLQVRLWVDDLSNAKAIITNLNIEKNQQICEEIFIEKWDDNADFTKTGEVVIETFACGLPEKYLTAMQAQKSKWVNLDYLSAEKWVDEFHGKPSPQNNGLTRYFYFPGFTEKTGGLIRESDVVLPLESLNNLCPQVGQGLSLNISLFCYQYSPVSNLLNALQTINQKIFVHVPQSIIWPKIAEYFGKSSIHEGEILTKNNLTVNFLPFLSQQNYDALLRECDLNFVRGEDSWIRAIWARKPFIWQPYLQTEDTHIKKLNAFIDLFYDYEQKEVLLKAHEYWAAEHAFASDFGAIWNNYFKLLPSIQVYTNSRSSHQAKQTDLATKLVIFCNKL